MPSEQIPSPARQNHPWEILAIAALFFVPGLFLLCVPGPIGAFHQSYRNMYPTTPELADTPTLRIYGAVALMFAAFLVGFYFRVRRSIALGSRAPNEPRCLFSERFVKENRN